MMNIGSHDRSKCYINVYISNYNQCSEICLCSVIMVCNLIIFFSFHDLNMILNYSSLRTIHSDVPYRISCRNVSVC